MREPETRSGRRRRRAVAAGKMAPNGSMKLEEYTDVAPQAHQMFADNVPERDRLPPPRLANQS